MDIMDFQHLENEKIYADLLNGEMETTQITGTTEVYESDNQVPVIKFRPFQDMDFIEHGFSTRCGGVSRGIYSSMNLTFERGDNPADVHHNFSLIAEALHTTPENMVCSKQTHTTNVLKVDESYRGMGIGKERSFDNIDGLVTNRTEVCLVTSFADCVPLFFVDPVRKCIGAAHSGWRGTVGDITANMVSLMQSEYGSDPCDIVTFIGPSICVDCYEVGKDVAEQFQTAYQKSQIKEILLPGKSSEKYQLNLQMANYYNMRKAGISPKHIYISDLCTCCNPKQLFSHRASKGQRGVLCGFMYIRS